MLRGLVCSAVVIASCARPPSQAPAPRAPEVDWRPWSEETFAEAARDGKHLLVSVQATWCHWCHVMNERTFGDPRVRAELASGFVAVRVDGDARPDLAERFRDYAWPATALFTPDARLVIALRGYRAPEAFLDVLRDVRAGRAPRETPAAGPPLGQAESLATTRAQLLDLADVAVGGFGTPQKYPYAAPLLVALRGELEGLDAAFVVRTLEGHAALLDPVDGGAYQYSLRGDWRHPHFERIAIVQADVLHAFAAHAWRTRDPRFLAEASRVEAFLAGPFRNDDGTFASSQDADLDAEVHGTEYFAWDADERAAHGTPRIDRAPYADRNGRVIEALVRLHVARLACGVDPGDALALAETAATRLESTHRLDGGGFRHGPADTMAGDDGLVHLADVAWMLRAELAIAEATGEPRWHAYAARTAAFLIEELTHEAGGFAAHTVDPRAVGDLARRRRPLVENAVAARALLRLARTSDDERWAGAADAAMAFDEASIRARGRQVGELALALAERAAPYAIVSVVGPAGDPRTEALHRAALSIRGARLVELGRPGESRYPYPGAPAAYLCNADACSVPVESPEALAGAFDRFFE
ncbi:MAG: thioredoxin domain-containing protein [Sandaracinus sp.]|nr:thioredoxin domain-containing protein [Sandaracinus sp.]MCB9613540.1 thioredoxin domain-containing protein [Sandaracinus sp.]MCB9619696.1 thioredoxin domain-containing protein [Sandaracinus sp.]